MLTQKSSKRDIQKVALTIIVNQHNKFTVEDIYSSLINQCEETIDKDIIEEVILKTLEYCWREIHLLDIRGSEYEINPERRELVGAFLNHEGVTV